MMRGRSILVAMLVAAVAVPAAAQKPVGIMPGFSDESGRQAVFLVQFPEAPPLTPGAISAAQAAAEFKRLCLDAGLDAARTGAAAEASTLQLSPSPLRYSGDRNTAAFSFEGWHGPSADVRVWTGDPRAFRRLPFQVIDSGVVISGPMKRLLPQCNLALESVSLADFQALVASVSAAAGTQPVASKSGKRWGQARWSVQGPNGSLTIGLRVDGLNKGSQTLHLGVVQPAKQADQ